jgi:hypothetical protein
MLTALGAVAGLIVLMFVVTWIFSGLFMWIGAKFAGVDRSSFWRSVFVALACSFVTYLSTALLSAIPGIGSLVGFLAGLAASLWVIKSMYNTSMRQALLVWIFDAIANVAAVVLGLLTFAAGVIGALAAAS